MAFDLDRRRHEEPLTLVADDMRTQCPPWPLRVPPPTLPSEQIRVQTPGSEGLVSVAPCRGKYEINLAFYLSPEECERGALRSSRV